MNRRLLPKLIIFWSLCFWLVIPRHSEAADFRISAAHPFLKNDSLLVSVSFENPFRDDVRKSLLAGLPLLFDCTTALQDEGGKTIAQKSRGGQIQYDVWEENFRITGFKRKPLVFEDLTKLTNWFRRFLIFNFGVPAKYYTGQNFRAQIDSRLTILTRKQNRQLSDWLRNSNQTEEDLPSQERTTGFKLNLNRIIQMFISRDKKNEEYRASVLTPVFQISELERR